MRTFDVIFEANYVTTKSTANITLLKSIKEDIKYISPALQKSDETLHSIARPLALKMTHIKSTYTTKVTHLRISHHLHFGHLVICDIYGATSFVYIYVI